MKIDELKFVEQILVNTNNICNDFDKGLHFKEQLKNIIPGIEEKLTVEELDLFIDYCYKIAIQEMVEYGLLKQN